MKFIKILFCILFISLKAFTQTQVSGTISDSLSGESLIGAIIVDQESQKSTATDLDGKFNLILPKGNHKLKFSYITYDVYEKEVIISDKPVILDIKLQPQVTEIKGVTITAESNKASVAELTQTQKNNSAVVDGTTAESFKKTPDSKASDVFKRISGVSIQEGKFVIIRGLNDRYNYGIINGATLPSSESDRKAFSFDIFPSNMIDNILVYKSGRPDLPGEFSGGVIEINTTELNSDKVRNIQIQSGHNTITTGREWKTYQTGPLDFLGFGSGSRAIPSGLPDTKDFATLTRIEKAKYAVLMNFDWNTKTITAPYNKSIQAQFGKKYKITDSQDFSYIFVYNWSQNFTQNLVLRKEFEESVDTVITKMELKDSVFTQNIINCGLLNFRYNINSKNWIKFKNLYSVNSEDRVNVRTGVRELDNDPRQWEKSTNFWYTQNNLLTQQLFGDHQFWKFKLDWDFGQSNIKRQIPNLRRTVYRKYSLLENDTTQDYVAIIQSNGTIPTASGNMFWSTCKENIYSGKLNLAFDFSTTKFKNQIKIGVFTQVRNREFESRNLGFSQYKPAGNSFNNQILLYSPDSIFSSQNLGVQSTGKGGFKLEESTRVDDSYTAQSDLKATYGMSDISILEKFRIISGARVESYRQIFKYQEDGSFIDKTIDTTTVDVLPSVNAIWSIGDFKIRSSYYKTVSRPEFRELAPFTFYNFILDNITSGNPFLRRSTIDNYDFRMEYYPSQTEIVSFSVFHKVFLDPIEMINRTGTSGSPELYFANAQKAKNIGIELEFRKGLGFLTKNENNFLNGVWISGNFSRIESKVYMQEFIGSDSIRPLQGQSPYIINSGLGWNNKKRTFSTSVSYNIVGPRIWVVGNVQEPSIWESTRNIIDYQISGIIKKFEIKLNIKDVLAQKLTYFQDLDSNKKFTKGDNDWQQINFGRTISLSVKFNF
jgi:TonB-dependent receptor